MPLGSVKRQSGQWIVLLPLLAAICILVGWVISRNQRTLPQKAAVVQDRHIAFHPHKKKGYKLATIISSPATSSGAAPRSFTFAIPVSVATIASAQWNATYSQTGSGFNDDLIKTPHQISIQEPHTAPISGSFSVASSVPLSQIADIAAAAGGNLTVTFDHSNPGWSDSITIFTLTVFYQPVDWGTPGGGFRSNRRRGWKIMHNR